MLAAACALVLGLGAMLAGCQSPWIACTIVNHQTTPVSLVVVNYPGGSFGVQSIAPGATYHYRFHALSTDRVSLDFTDASHKDRTVKGPELEQGEAGTLQIEIRQDNSVAWTPVLKRR